MKEALETAFPSWSDLAIAGRTDAGVHALENVASVEVEGGPPSNRAREALNAELPPDVVVLEAEEAAADFHARHSALARSYRYRIYRREARSPFEAHRAWWYPHALDEERLAESADLVRGEHDFRAFTPTETQHQVFVRVVESAVWYRREDALEFEITVEAVGGESVSARIIASEPGADLSLLKVDRVPTSMRAATMADSKTVRVGDQVMIIGAPYGLSHSMSVGWISARWPPNTVYKHMPLAEFFQTTATINTGNSGGPMFNMAGEVIGIVSHNISKSGGSEGLGFVVTINTAKKLLLEKASFWSGIDGTMLTGELAAIFNVPDPPAFLVKTVAKGSPADEIGIRGGTSTATIDGHQVVVGGDIVLSVEGIAVGSPDALKQIRQRAGEVMRAFVGMQIWLERVIVLDHAPPWPHHFCAS